MSGAPPCPSCGGTSYQLAEKRWLTCKSCGSEFDVQTDVCRACGQLNQAQTATCAHCGAKLPHDSVHKLIESRSKDRGAWYKERTVLGVQQKKKEEQASRERMESYWAEERARREAAARAMSIRQSRERKTLIVVGVISAILVLILVATALALSRWFRAPIGLSPLDTTTAISSVRWLFCGGV